MATVAAPAHLGPSGSIWVHLGPSGSACAGVGTSYASTAHCAISTRTQKHLPASIHMGVCSLTCPSVSACHHPHQTACPPTPIQTTTASLDPAPSAAFGRWVGAGIGYASGAHLGLYTKPTHRLIYPNTDGHIHRHATPTYAQVLRS